MSITFPNLMRRRVLPGAAARVSKALVQAAGLSTNEALELLGTSLDGLTDTEAENRLETHGANAVAHETAPAWYSLLVHSYANPFNAILVLLAIVSVYIDVIVPPAEDKSW